MSAVRKRAVAGAPIPDVRGPARGVYALHLDEATYRRVLELRSHQLIAPSVAEVARWALNAGLDRLLAKKPRRR